MEFERLLSESWFGSRYSGTRALVGVSGGADSVALACGLARIVSDNSRLLLAHFNHGWRGEESEADRDFVVKLADELGLEVRVGEAEDPSAARSEEHARDKRYAFFEETAYAAGCRCIVTAHTLSDRVETGLHNLFRGTGISGMRSIQKIRPLGEELIVVRPILERSRQEVLAYLKQLDQEHREDSSNHDQRYKRNFIRKTLLPRLREEYGGCVDENIARFSEIAQDIDSMLNEQAEAYWRQVSVMLPGADLEAKDSLQIPSANILPVHWPVLQRAVQIAWNTRSWPLGKMNSEHWNRIRIVHEGQGAEGFVCNLPYGLTLQKQAEWALVTADSKEKR